MTTICQEDPNYPVANSRIISSITEATTIYFPENPDDGARMGFVDIGMTAALTLDGNGRLIENLAYLIIDPESVTPLSRAEWLYRSDLGGWIRLETLTATDQSPLPKEFDGLLIAWTNMLLCPGQGKEPSQATVDARERILSKLKQRYRQHVAVTTPASGLAATQQTYSDNPWE